MSDNHTHYFDHIGWHVAAKSAIQMDFEFQPKCWMQKLCQILENHASSPLLYYQGEDLPKWNMPWGFFLFPLPIKVSYFLGLFHERLPTQSTVLAAQILALASGASCVQLLLHPVINVPGLHGIPSIQLGHFLSVSVLFSHVCCSWHAGLTRSAYI